jgi:hypothetical protein
MNDDVTPEEMSAAIARGLANTGMHDAVVVRRTDNHHGYPYRAECRCGYRSQSYAAPHAAQPFADEHNQGE